jgi:hypothetical protein
MEFPLWSLQESEFYRETQHDSSHWPTRVSWTVGRADDDDGDDDDTELVLGTKQLRTNSLLRLGTL